MNAVEGPKPRATAEIVDGATVGATMLLVHYGVVCDLCVLWQASLLLCVSFLRCEYATHIAS